MYKFNQGDFYRTFTLWLNMYGVRKCSELTGISASTLSRLSNRKRKLHLEEFLRICNAHGFYRSPDRYFFSNGVDFDANDFDIDTTSHKKEVKNED